MADRYPYRSLTSALDDKTSPLRTYFDHRFPGRAYHQSVYGDSAGPLPVPDDASGGSSWPHDKARDVVARARFTMWAPPSALATAAMSHSPTAC